MANEFDKGQLVQHKTITFLGRVKGPDPRDNRKVVVQSLTGDSPFSCHKEKLIPLS